MDWVKLHCLIAREGSVASVCVCRGRCRYGTFCLLPWDTGIDVERAAAGGIRAAIGGLG